MFSPGTLQVPIGVDGFPSFSLASLAAANGFNGTQAHDARNDVLATLHLARLIRDEAPAVWNTFMRFAHKSSVLLHIQEEQVFGYAEFYKGRPYSWLVTHIGVSAADKNSHYVFDLQFDPDDFAAMTDEELVVHLDELPRPIKKLRPTAARLSLPSRTLRRTPKLAAWMMTNWRAVSVACARTLS